MPLALLVVIVSVSLADRGNRSAKSPSLSVLPVLSAAQPTPSGQSGEAACARVLGALPLRLGDLNPRAVTAQWVVAWGDPPIVLRCGIARPAALTPASGALVININGVNWLPVQQKDATIFTAIDRPVYVEVTVPKSSAFQPLPLIADAITKALKPVCEVPVQGQTASDNRLCTHRP